MTNTNNINNQNETVKNVTNMDISRNVDNRVQFMITHKYKKAKGSGNRKYILIYKQERK